MMQGVLSHTLAALGYILINLLPLPTFKALNPVIYPMQEYIRPKAPTPTLSYKKEEKKTYEDVYKAAGEKYGLPWQVLYGLHLTETGLRDGEIYNAQGTGAQGPMQFMPGTWNAYGVDGSGDGKADINNAVDAIHGAANFLAKHGGVKLGLHYYGGNAAGTLFAACETGYCQ